MVDGVPTYYADVRAPFTAMLAFRVGRADETLVTAGLTHLVEHVAIPIDHPHGLDVNGTVGPSTTLVWASGHAQDALEFVSSVAASLASLPVDRFETERRILETEAAGGSPGTIGLAFALRFGARGYGLMGHLEHGLNRLRAEDVAAWARERFTRENAVLWLTEKPPRGFSLPLPNGRRFPAPEPEPLADVPFPAVYDRADGIVVTCLGRREAALAAAASIAHRRLRRRLRFEGGLSYSVDWIYEPLTGDVAHLVFTADLLSTNAAAVRDGILETLAELSRDGPTADELEREVEQVRHDLSDPHGTGALHFMALNELLGGRDSRPRRLLDEHRALTRRDVAHALATALETALLLVPEETGGEAHGYVRYPMSSSRVVTGKRHHPGRIRRRNHPHLVAGADGLSLVVGDETSVVRFDECEALLRGADGTRVLWSTDGFYIHIDPELWRGADKLAALVDTHVPEDLWVPIDPEREARLEAVAQAAATGETKRSWLTSTELDTLPDLLTPDEKLLLATKAQRGWQSGLIAVTQRRMLFLYFDDVLLDVPLAQIESVSTSERWRLLLGRKLVVETGEATHTFRELEREPLERLAALLRPVTP